MRGVRCAGECLALHFVVRCAQAVKFVWTQHRLNHNVAVASEELDIDKRSGMGQTRLSNPSLDRQASCDPLPDSTMYIVKICYSVFSQKITSLYSEVTILRHQYVARFFVDAP